MKKQPVDAKIWIQERENWFSQRAGMLRGASFVHRKTSSRRWSRPSQSSVRSNGHYYTGFRIVRNKDQK